MNSTTQPLPNHEILPEPSLRQWGAVEGMEDCAKAQGIWKPSRMQVGQAIHPLSLEQHEFRALLGTMAMVSTPLPEVRCKMSSYCEDGEHDNDCPAHPRNRLVKVLPGRLARLKEKPKGLVYNNGGHIDKGGTWVIPRCGQKLDFKNWLGLDRDAGDFAYALPARVLAEIEGKEKEYATTPTTSSERENRTGREADKAWPVHQRESGVPDSGTSGPIASLPATGSDAGIQQHSPSENRAVSELSNAAPSKSQPSEVAATKCCQHCGGAGCPSCQPIPVPATSPTADEMLAWQESHKAVPKFMESGLVFLSYYKPDKYFYIGPFPNLRLAIANAMKEGK